eukprot:TRINITY_DN18898_c0_g1_i1.p1 TRINITY_DN18898_c0_g1~~TRINITY_DN18898_c0_g1_i1.p1  ORF type:complete len:210 (+),score=41.58 TRINITY_DN18898_c0_g1_i1:81-710(+)
MESIILLNQKQSNRLKQLLTDLNEFADEDNNNSNDDDSINRLKQQIQQLTNLLEDTTYTFSEKPQKPKKTKKPDDDNNSTKDKKSHSGLSEKKPLTKNAKKLLKIINNKEGEIPTNITNHMKQEDDDSYFIDMSGINLVVNTYMKIHNLAQKEYHILDDTLFGIVKESCKYASIKHYLEREKDSDRILVKKDGKRKVVGAVVSALYSSS